MLPDLLATSFGCHPANHDNSSAIRTCKQDLLAGSRSCCSEKAHVISLVLFRNCSRSVVCRRTPKSCCFAHHIWTCSININIMLEQTKSSSRQVDLKAGVMWACALSRAAERCHGAQDECSSQMHRMCFHEERTTIWALRPRETVPLVYARRCFGETRCILWQRENH